MTAPALPASFTPNPSDLGALEMLAWMQLDHAVTNRKHGFHLGVMGTSDDTGLPDMRLLVLRRVNIHERQFFTHTDLRAPKVSTIAKRPTTAWLFFDPTVRLQLRIRTHSILADTVTIDRHWNASTLTSKRCYLAPGVPSTECSELDVNLPDGLSGVNPTSEEAQAGRRNFTVILNQVERLEVLHLACTGHVRAGFDYNARETTRSYWLRT